MNKIVITCTSKEETNCLKKDLWCIIDGRICSHLVLGQSEEE